MRRQCAGAQEARLDSTTAARRRYLDQRRRFWRCRFLPRRLTQWLSCRTKKRLLENVSGQVGPGFTAIMGEQTQAVCCSSTRSLYWEGEGHTCLHRALMGALCPSAPCLLPAQCPLGAPCHLAPPPRCAAAAAGPSGAGKSTLLNALACRLDKGAVLEGKVRLNGQTYELAHLKRIARWEAQSIMIGVCDAG